MSDDLTERWNRISLRTKVTGVIVLLLTLGLMVAGVGTATVLRASLYDEVDRKVAEANATMVNSLTISGTIDDPRCEVSSLPNDLYLAVVKADGVVVCANRRGEDPRPSLTSFIAPGVGEKEGPFSLPGQTPNQHWRVLTYGIDSDGLTVVTGMSLKDAEATVARYTAIFLFFGLTVVIFGGALTRLLVTSTFEPLRQVEETAARFADGDFNQRLSGGTPNTEVGRLNRSLNSMLGRIDRALAERSRTIDQMRRFVGDASHELRTPLVSVRGYAELYRMGALQTPEEVAQAMERIEKEAIRMTELVEDLLALARIDGAKPQQLTEVDLVPLARDAALDTMAAAPDRVVTVVATDVPAAAPHDVDPPTKVIDLPDLSAETNTPGRGATLATGPIAFAGAQLARLRGLSTRSGRTADLTAAAAEAAAAPAAPEPRRAIVLGEENKIRQVLANLIGNALRFTPPGSPLEIGVGTDPDNNLAILSVIDHGEGIPEQIRGKIFERFWRADTSRARETGGTGLGLAIVSAIVATHNGEVKVVETPGGGATFRVQLPLLPREAEPKASTDSA